MTDEERIALARKGQEYLLHASVFLEKAGFGAEVAQIDYMRKKVDDDIMIIKKSD